ncbi:hypothetical protein [Amycolatopsis sp. NPDC051372]|uniref:hypothetical protein n=1 Tax=Amycolatopsis sp. NPDC051372 TaxID=3155669 RepID=UPI003415C400
MISTYHDLADAAEYVTTVIRFVDRGIFKPAPVDLLSMLDEIMGRIEAASAEMAESAEMTADERAVADHQHAYAALLHLLYSEFLKQKPSAD